MRIPREYEIPLLLGMACVLLTIAVSGEWLWKVSSQRETRAKIAAGGAAVADKPESVAAKAFELPPPERFDGVVERPLFIRGRRPPPPPSVAAPPPPPTKPLEAALHGVVFGPDGVVVLIHDKAGKHYRFRKGEGLEGWVLTEIAKDRVVMTHGATHQELLLQKPKPKEAAKAPAPAAKPPEGADRADGKRKKTGE